MMISLLFCCCYARSISRLKMTSGSSISRKKERRKFGNLKATETTLGSLFAFELIWFLLLCRNETRGADWVGSSFTCMTKSSSREASEAIESGEASQWYRA